MAIKSIIRLGNPILRKKSTSIKNEDFNSSWLLALVQDLWDSKAHYGGVGIAAPQIGVNRRVCVFGFEHSERYKHVDPIPYTVLCNPEIIIIDKTESEMIEGCLSVDSLRGPVSRPVEIEYSGYDAYGNSIKRQVKDFHARLVMHEVDHLDGIVFIDKVTDTKRMAFLEELV